jgi:hypothetical protein
MSTELDNLVKKAKSKAEVFETEEKAADFEDKNDILEESCTF